MLIPDDDKKEIFLLAILNGMLGGFMSPDCDMEELMEDIDSDDFDEFFCD